MNRLGGVGQGCPAPPLLSKGEGLMTADEFAAEDYRHRRPSRVWYPLITVGLVLLLVGSFRLAAAVMDRIFR